MSVFVKATPPPKVKTSRIMQISLFYAVVLGAMALAQLYTFEEFTGLVFDFNLPFPDSLSYALVPLLIIFEVFALPFLLRMRVSPAFRVLSMVCGWLVAATWLFITLWLVITNQQVTSVGFLGTVAELIPGAWAVFFSLALGILAYWVSWGMWPYPFRKTSAKNKL
jgi:hypothetical protein